MLSLFVKKNEKTKTMQFLQINSSLEQMKPNMTWIPALRVAAVNDVSSWLVLFHQSFETESPRRYAHGPLSVFFFLS